MRFHAWNKTFGRSSTSTFGRGPLPRQCRNRDRFASDLRKPLLHPLSPEELDFMEETRRIALYARISSQRQADEMTIQSQIAALKQRIASDGFTLDAELVFLDDGFSGASLQRPALERLRDLAHLGGIGRLYVHSPDRLARNFVHQFLLLEEFKKCRVEVVFLNQPIAEYERAKILERTRLSVLHEEPWMVNAER
jgi:hypothetical protein